MHFSKSLEREIKDMTGNALKELGLSVGIIQAEYVFIINNGGTCQT